MKRLLLKILALGLLNAALYALIVTAVESRHAATNWQKPSHFYTIPKDQQFDMVLLGSSEGWAFSRDGNHHRMENILGMKVFNLSKPGAGLVPAKVYLSYFYKRGNRTKRLVYYLDQWIFYSDKWNEKCYFLDREPIRPGVLPILLENKVHPNVIHYYFSKKLSPRHMFHFEKNVRHRDNRRWTVLPTSILKKTVRSLYPDKLNSANFEHYSRVFHDIVDMAQRHGAEVTVVLPSAMFTVNVTGSKRNRWLELLERTRRERGVRVYDWRAVLRDGRFFVDPHHLNTDGILEIVKRLKRVFDKEES